MICNAYNYKIDHTIFLIIGILAAFSVYLRYTAGRAHASVG